MVVVSLDMFLNNTQDTFVKYKNDKFCLVKGHRNSGKTISIIFKALYLKRNYCFEKEDKILFLTSKEECGNVSDIFNYINRSDLYKSIIPSDDIEVHVLSYEDLVSLKMDKVYAHVIIDNIEKMDENKITYIFSLFKNCSYSKVYFIQNSIDNIENVLSILECSRKLIGVREGVFKFRYVIDNGDRDEFTQISMTPDIKYLNYTYKEYVDFCTKKINGYYTKCRNLYIDKGTFLHNVTNESLDICLLNRELNIKGFVKVFKQWMNYKEDLCFVEIDDEGMGRYDLFRGDIVLIDRGSKIENGDVVVILKNGYIYARKFIEDENKFKFISSENIFKEIRMDDDVIVLGKVLGYIREY